MLTITVTVTVMVIEAVRSCRKLETFTVFVNSLYLFIHCINLHLFTDVNLYLPFFTYETKFLKCA